MMPPREYRSVEWRVKYKGFEYTCAMSGFTSATYEEYEQQVINLLHEIYRDNVELEVKGPETWTKI